MLPLRYPAHWRIANGLLLAAVFAMAFLPALWVIQSPPEWPGVDKWLHGLTFMVLAIWYAGQYARGAYWRIAAGLIAYGLMIEIGQSMIPYRTAEWGDVAADVAGIAAGLLIASGLTGGWSLRAEDWIGKKIG